MVQEVENSMNEIKNKLISIFSQILAYETYNTSDAKISLEEDIKLWDYISDRLLALDNNIFVLLDLEKTFKFLNLTDDERKYIRECLKVLDAYKDNTLFTLSNEQQTELLNNIHIKKAINQLKEIHKIKRKLLEGDIIARDNCKQLEFIINYLKDLKENEYIEIVNQINGFLFSMKTDFNIKINISKLIAKYNVLVGKFKKNQLTEDIQQLKSEVRENDLLNSQKRIELEKLFANYGYDINLLSDEMLRRMIKYGDLIDMEDVFKFYQTINLKLKLDSPEHEKYLFVLYKSNKQILDVLLEIANKYNINIMKLLSTTCSAFMSKKSNLGHSSIDIEGNAVNIVGANEDFVANIQLFESLGYDVKGSYERCPSIFVYSNSLLKQNIEALKTYGLDVKNMPEKIKLTGLKNPKILFTIDQFIELDELSYLFNNTSRLEWPPNEAMFYRLYDVKKYNELHPDNPKKYKNVDKEGNTVSLKSFVSHYNNESTGINAANKLVATNTINPNIVDGHDYTNDVIECLEEVSGKSTQFTNDEKLLIESLDATFRVDDLRYNIAGKTYSRFKFLRLFMALKDYDLGLNMDKLVLLSMTYNSIISQDEYMMTKDALESLKRGRN